ncbi:molecular chaperone HtpG [bacterium]|nr:molecular chaperone HtpG [candidate division CSSED10-310 bacterium]
MTKRMDKSTKETFNFQAEVAQVLNIVINSLYTDREIFVRELISNAADALEKFRHLTLTESDLSQKDRELKIDIMVDEKAKTFTITDNGIGMTKDELLENLGSIAHSGSADFLKRMAENLKSDVHLIGQFGVGFYSVFMVAKKVTVQTCSCHTDDPGYEWESTGDNSFTIQTKPDLSVGTKIILHLKDDAVEFAKPFTIRQSIKKFSSFVPIPIFLNGDRVNTIQAVWTRTRGEVKDEEYVEFYKYLSGGFDDPLDWMHFATDAPLSIHSLLYIPTENVEKYGFFKLESGVDLHCKKILIQKGAKDILPPYFRFIKGVVDSEDIPLNISRESMQDSLLLKKINRVLTGRLIKHFDTMSKNEPEKYLKFWKTFGPFIKEGIVSDQEQRDNIAKLLRFQTSKTKEDEMISLDEYVGRMPDNQKEIYFINGEDRSSILSGPYAEVFLDRDIELIFNFDPIDDFVMNHLGKYLDKSFISAESETIKLPEKSKIITDTSETTSSEKIDKKITKQLQTEIKKILGDKIADVRASERLVESPVILINPMSQITGAMQRIIRSVNKENIPTSHYIFEFNPHHHLIQKLSKMIDSHQTMFELVIEQLYDQAALAAGLPVEIKTHIDRIYKIIDKAVAET